MTYPSGPIQPLPLDGPGQRRRRLATAGGIIGVAGIVVAGMTLTNRPARQPVSPQEALGQPPSASDSAPASEAAPASGTAPTSSPPPTTTASTQPTPPSSVPSAATSAPPAATASSADIDGDGRPDASTIRFLSKRSAQLVVQLSSGKTLTSKAFPLYRQDTAGTVTPFDVNGDGRSEMFVTDPGADGTGYELFAYGQGALVEVASPTGQQQPFLYSGGGMYYASSFGCSGKQLVVAREEPVVAGTASLPPDPKFRVTTTTYALLDARLSAVSTRAETVANRAAAAALLTRTAGACGARP